jgi:hypothetical protein
VKQNHASARAATRLSHARFRRLTFRLEQVRQSQLSEWIARLLVCEREFPVRDGDD